MFDSITIVGVGLISGSFSLALKDKGLVKNVIGVSRTKASLDRALELGLIDEALPLEEAVKKSDLIYVAIPVDVTVPMMRTIMDLVTDRQVVTEYSGPEAAVHNAFAGRSCVICEREKSAPDAVEIVEGLYRDMGMHLVYMDADSHDMHAAYISHISHITSFALANTVLEKEKEESAIFELAGGGFESTVRLAKSSPAMWLPIFMQNRENVLDVLNEHISQLRKFKACLEKENADYLRELMENANRIRRIIK
jgi:prephenate dehydrogenase